MRKLFKGSTYLVRSVKYWYIVQQTGMKSWDALIFSHVSPETTAKYLHGNSSSLVTLLQNTAHEVKFYRFTEDSELRRAMFEILKTGKYEGVEI